MNSKYLATAQSGAQPVVTMSREVFPGCIFVSAEWFTAPSEDLGMSHRDSDEMFILVGSDEANPESLNAEMELQIENDTLTLTHTCAVFVPGGAARGNFRIKSLTKPVLCVTCHVNADTYESTPAVPTAPKGAYANNVAERYAPPSGVIPAAPEGFLTLLLYLSSERIKGAPYMEIMWFNTANDTGPTPHVHDDIDEFIGFLGTDPEHPDELGATVQLYIDDEPVTVTKSSLFHIPRGVKHGPLLVPELSRPIIHFSGGNGGGYDKRATAGTEEETAQNSYKP
ncbi:MAG: hypothetical protein LBN30_03120 [Oscillospiraceae bacterium]|jgi:hypothetical protein|nr:hypothetical protein [Oscillospiraceae bacterium]